MSSNEMTNQGGGTIFCAHCGTKNAADVYSCDRCGERIYLPDPLQPPPMGLAECPRCVTANESRATYCVKCGSSMANAARISVLGGSERARQAPHADPSGIRISSRSREAPRPARRPPPPQARPPAERSPENIARQREEQERQRAREREQQRQVTERQQPRRSEQPPQASGGPFVNDSGTRSARLPIAARGWNTAAFLIAPIWGPANGVWIGVISLVFLAIPPEALDWIWKFLLYFAFGAYMALKGNEMAWRARRWNSVEHFKRVQQLWMVGALAVGMAIAFLLPVMLQD